jgi:hypothetical protein
MFGARPQSRKQPFRGLTWQKDHGTWESPAEIFRTRGVRARLEPEK